jgi:hypothetical protein
MGGAVDVGGCWSLVPGPWRDPPERPSRPSFFHPLFLNYITGSPSNPYPVRPFAHPFLKPTGNTL